MYLSKRGSVSVSWLVFVLLWASYEGSQTSVRAEVEDHVVRTQTIDFNQDVTLRLNKGQALQLNCPDNQHQINYFIVYFYDADVGGKQEPIIRVDAVFNTGYSSGGGSRVSRKGALRQAGHSPCLVITEWQVKTDTIQVQFRASDNLSYNHEIYRRWEAEKRHFSKMYKDWSLMPVKEISEAERLAGFARLWSEAKYNFAFFDQVPELDWEGVLEQYIPKVQAARTLTAYYRVLRECIALLKDGHTSVWGPEETFFCGPPMRLGPVGKKAVVTELFPMEKVVDEMLVQEWRDADIRLGDTVTHIDGRTVHAVLNKSLYPWISASTPQALDRKAYPQLLLGPSASKVTLDVVGRDGSVKQVTLTRASYLFPRKRSPFECKSLGNSIIYVNLPSFGSKHIVEQLDGAFDQIRQAKGLILDVRQNGGGSTRHGYAILRRLVKQEVQGGRYKTRKHVAAHKAWGRDEAWEEGHHSTVTPHDSLHYGGPVVVLTGPGTFSAAEDFVAVFQYSGRGKVIGQRTGGSTGQPLQVKLPGGGSARICTKRDTYPDGREFVGIGCIPDIEVEPTDADIATGRDAVLERAKEVLRKEIR